MKNPNKLVQPLLIDAQKPFHGQPVPLHFTLPVVTQDVHNRPKSEPPTVLWPEHGIRVLTVDEILKSLTETVIK